MSNFNLITGLEIVTLDYLLLKKSSLTRVTRVTGITAHQSSAHSAVFVIIPLSHGSADSVDQRTAEFAGTLSGISVPQRRRRVWLSAAQSGSRPLFGGGNATRTAPLQTEPTHTLRCVCVLLRRTCIDDPPLMPFVTHKHLIKGHRLGSV